MLTVRRLKLGAMASLGFRQLGLVLFASAALDVPRASLRARSTASASSDSRSSAAVWPLSGRAPPVPGRPIRGDVRGLPGGVQSGCRRRGGVDA